MKLNAQAYHMKTVPCNILPTYITSHKFYMHI